MNEKRRKIWVDPFFFRFSDSFLTYIIEHEAAHKANYKAWHDEHYPDALRDFSRSFVSCARCNEYKAERIEHYNNDLRSFTERENAHVSPNWPADYQAPLPEYGPEADWGPPLPPPLDPYLGLKPFPDPLGRF